MSKFRAGLFVVAAAFAVAGCSSTNTEQKPAPAPEVKPVPPPPPPPPPPKAEPEPVKPPPPPQVKEVDPLDDPTSALHQRSVYFDFDRDVLKATDAATVEAHGHYLVDHGNRMIRVEGNCDERGSREYNVALGQRRANAVRDRLKSIGVAADRIETTSFGKEKPRTPGHSEAAWADNRRADIVYK